MDTAVTLITLALISAKSALPFSTNYNSSSQPCTSNILLASFRYAIIVIKTQLLVLQFVLRLAILLDTLSLVLLQAVYIDQ